MRNGSERKSSSSSSPLDCDVGLGLKMQLQPTESYSCDGGGGTFFSNTSNQLACMGDIYGAAALRDSGGGMAVSGKALFTASQWQELERQNMIHKYIMASIPVPPELLLPTARSSALALASVSQSNTSGLDLRYSSSGSDPEPWRCKRTDGKKWRCSRDVAPDQKYCERHAHKSRPRSRKHVEVSSHIATSNNYSQQPPTTTTTTTPPQPFQRSTSQFPTMASAISYDQTRSIEWFMRGGTTTTTTTTTTIPVSTCNQEQWQQQLMQISSSRMDFNRDNTDHNNKNVSLYQPQYEDKQGFMNLNPYNIPDNHRQLSDGQCCNSILDSKMTSLQGCLSLNVDETQTTRHFIDAWEKESSDLSLSKKFSPSSLTLSMSGEDNENGELGLGMINSDRDNSDGIMKPQWMNTVSWMNSTPGGPLGEALCLGNATTRGGGGSNLASPHGYSNSSNTNTNSSSCSKSSCGDASHALNFIG